MNFFGKVIVSFIQDNKLIQNANRNLYNLSTLQEQPRADVRMALIAKKNEAKYIQWIAVERGKQN